MARWLYTINGKEFGPVTEKKIVELVLDETLNLESYIMSNEKPLWVKLSTVKPIMDKIHSPEIHLNYDNKELAKFVGLELNGDVVDTTPMYFNIPILRFIFMSILTGGLYQWYWFYRQWSYLRRKSKSGFRSFDRVGTYIFFPWYIIGRIADDQELNKVVRSSFNSFWLATGWVFSDLFLGRVIAGYDKTLNVILYYFISANIGLLFLIPVQNYITSVNIKLKKDFSSKTFGHYVLIAFSILSIIIMIVISVLHSKSIFKMDAAPNEIQF